jgi:PAS domain S-box-containing protein
VRISDGAITAAVLDPGNRTARVTRTETDFKLPAQSQVSVLETRLDEAPPWLGQLLDLTGLSELKTRRAALVATDPATGLALLACASAAGGPWLTSQRELIESWTRLYSHVSNGPHDGPRLKALEREALMQRLLHALNSGAESEDVFTILVHGLGMILEVTAASLLQFADVDAAPPSESASEPLIRAEYRAIDSTHPPINSQLIVESNPLLPDLLAGSPVMVADVSTSHALVQAIGVRLGLRAMLLAPVVSARRTRAVLVLAQCDRTRSFADDEISLVKTAAAQAAMALEVSEMHRQLREAEQRETLIRRATAALESSHDQDAFLQTLVEELGRSLCVCRSSLALMAYPMAEHLRAAHEYAGRCCSSRGMPALTVEAAENRFLQSVLASSTAMVATDVGQDRRLGLYGQRLAAAGIKSVLAAAVRSEGRPVAALILCRCNQHRAWTKWETEAVQSAAHLAGAAIRRANLERELHDSATKIALVNQVLASVRRSLDLEQILQVTVEELGRALGASRINFFKLVEGEVQAIAEFVTDSSLSIKHLPSDCVIKEALLESGRALTVQDGSKAAGTLSQVICPIYVNDRVWGALSVGRADEDREWSSSEIALIEAIRAQVEVAASQSQLLEEAKLSLRREALISHIIHGINQSNRLDEILLIVARGLGEHLGVDEFLIASLGDQTGGWRIESFYRNDEALAAGGPAGEEVLRWFGAEITGPVLCGDTQTEGKFPATTSVGAFMSVPVGLNGSPYLMMLALMRSRARQWSADELDIVRAAADQVLIAFQRAELFDEVSHGKHEWESTFEALTDGIFIFDQRGVLRRANQAAAALTEIPVNELLGRRCCALLQGFEGEPCRVGPVIASGRPVTFELSPERLSRAMLVTISPLVNGSGSIGAVCIVRDLSELRAAEAAAREQRSFLAKLIEHANDALFALSPDGRFVWFNEQLCRLSGYSHEELQSIGHRRLVPREERNRAEELFQRALAGEVETFEMRGRKKSGDKRLLLVTYTPIYDAGRLSSVLTIARDITDERLAAERAAQADKLRALGQLASGVAHNFNNVLAAIVGHAQLLKRDVTGKELAARVEIIERAALDGAQTVKRIQGFALQQNDTAFETVDINQLVQDSTNLTRARWCDDAQSRGLTYDVDLRFDALPRAMGSASELREVFVNLILNALDAMPQGGRLAISTKAGGRSIQVSFADNGVGMSRDVRERIFEPFFTTKSTAGMGLGLAVSYGIIERHGGKIEVRSEPGRGSTFTVVVPVAGSAERRVVRNGAAKSRSVCTILVIDDDSRVGEALAGMLRSAGHRADWAASGREGLAKLEQRPFQIVITDLSMPGMDGWAVATEIRGRWPKVKIILVSGFAVPAETVEARADLVDAVFLKPIRIDEITEALNGLAPGN